MTVITTSVVGGWLIQSCTWARHKKKIIKHGKLLYRFTGKGLMLATNINVALA